MRLARRREVLLDADVQLLSAEPKPDAAARRQRRRLLDLCETEELSEEVAGGGLAAGRGGELDVIDRSEQGGEG